MNKKNKQIGFKACLDEDKPNEKVEIESAQISAIEEDVEQRLNAEREYEEHMVNFHKLKKENRLFRLISYIIGFILILVGVYFIGYFSGAKDQITDNKIYKKITDQTGKTYIVFKNE